jgi:MSHA biogenesis protein MshI
MKLPLPFLNRSARGDRLVVGCGDDVFVYAQADGTSNALRRCGIELRGSDTPQAFAKRVKALDLPARSVVAVLPLAECQLLQIEAPAVPPAELKAAARWRIKELIDAHLDDLTLDVMVVGDGRPRATKQLFVAAAHTRAVRETGDWTRAAGLQLGVIDIRETAQRNLQTAFAQARGRGERATAALMLHGAQCLLTISAAGELFYARRLDWDVDTLRADAGDAAAAQASPADATAELSFDEMDIVDYGAEPEVGARPDEGDVPRIVIELQRSLDVWERSWPELPLAGISVQAGEQSKALAALLERSLGMSVDVLEPRLLFANFERVAATPAVREAVLPLLGALLRDLPSRA